ncbi:MAG TPA: FMN-binding negative transcriptional regulator [Thermoanaerobaculia bacterium]|nr:FMN-binding negative transcriptional regulator [Thermoanaerobaculia bacterium]
MYVPRSYRGDDAEIREVIRSHPFATLVSCGESPLATHVPLELVEGDPPVLFGHMARANPHWKALDPAREVLAIFKGPDAYVSPRWYAEPNVPTWNYVAVHAWGIPRLIEERGDLIALVSAQVARFESGTGYTLESLPPDLLEKDLRGIVGLEIRVTRLEASFKLSQNRDDADHANVVRQLEGGSPQQREIAAWMLRRRSPAQGSG